MPNNRLYRGFPDRGVYCGDLTKALGMTIPRPLVARTDIRGDTWPPAAFAWGTDCPGARELSLALLADVMDDHRKALCLAGTFSDYVIARLPADEPWIMSDNVVRSLASMIAREPLPC